MLWMARFKDPGGHIVALRHEVPKGLQADGKLIETTVADTRLDWPDLMTGHADLWDGAEVEISGWVTPNRCGRTPRLFSACPPADLLHRVPAQ